MTMHVFKFQNQIEWIQVVKIGELKDELHNFTFSETVPIKFNYEVQNGLIISKIKD